MLTPNRDELTLFGDVDGDGDGDAPSVTDVAVGRGVTVASFGEVAAADGRRWCDAVEADGLGTSGSGDVLAGAIAGAAARSGDPVRAACWALYAHRCAGSRLARHVGPTGYLARELADQLAPVVADIAAGGSGDGDERLGGVTGSSRR